MELSLDTLGALSRMKGLGQEDLLLLKAFGRLDLFAKGAKIFAEGQNADALYTVVDGFVKVVKNLEPPKILHIFGSGESFGELALVKSKIFPASSFALTELKVFVIPASVYDDLKRRSLNFSDHIAVNLACRPGFLTTAIANFNDGDVSDRIRRVFLDLFQRFGRDQGEWLELPFQLSRLEVASLINARPETASRAMNKFEKDGILVRSSLGFRAPKKNWTA